VAQAEVGLRHTHGEVTVPEAGEQFEFGFGFGGIVDALRAIDLGGQNVDFLPDRRVRRKKMPERGRVVGRGHHGLGQFDSPAPAAGPQIGVEGAHGAGGFGRAFDDAHFLGGVGRERIDRDDDRDAEPPRDRNVGRQIFASGFHQTGGRLQVSPVQRPTGNHLRPAAVHLERADGRHQHHRVRSEA